MLLSATLSIASAHKPKTRVADPIPETPRLIPSTLAMLAMHAAIASAECYIWKEEEKGISCT